MDITAVEPGTADSEIVLRAERDAGGPGRTYTLVYAATDASGNSTSATAVATVPHDLGSGPEPILLQVSPAGSPDLSQLAWPSLPGATGYDVIRGDLRQITPAPNRILLGTVLVLARGTTQRSIIDETAGCPRSGRPSSSWSSRALNAVASVTAPNRQPCLWNRRSATAAARNVMVSDDPRRRRLGGAPDGRGPARSSTILPGPPELPVRPRRRVGTW